MNNDGGGLLMSSIETKFVVVYPNIRAAPGLSANDFWERLIFLAQLQHKKLLKL